MKVLLLHQHFNTPYSGGAIRSYYLAKALADRGIRVEVITGYNGNETKTTTMDGITVHYLPVSYANDYGFYRRILSFLRFVWRSARMLGNFRDVDFCYAISVPLTTGLIAMYGKWRFGVPFIFEVGDLWPEAPIQMGFIRNRFLQKLLYSLECRIYQSASAVVALSPSIQKAIEQKIKGKRIHLVPNMSDTDFFRVEDKDPALEEKFGTANRFVISYTGAIGLANGLEHFVACAKASEDAGLPVRFLLCGAGAMLPKIKEQVSAYGLRNFNIIPFQNRDGVKEVLNVSDAIFISYQPVPVLETGCPNKYFDGLASGKLIVVNFKGWIRDEIEKNRCGFYVDPFNPGSFVSGMRTYLDLPLKLKGSQQASRALAEQEYSRQLIGERFVRIFG